MENHHLTPVNRGAFEANMQVETQSNAGNSAASGTRSTAQEEMELLKKKLKEVEQETELMRAQFERETGMQVQEESAPPLSLADKQEIDSRSIYVGNVDYECTVEEVQQHFESCGIINRITILTDSFGNPKGYAYVEFAGGEAVQNALDLNDSELHGRQLKVSAKRTNVPGMRQPRGRRFPRGAFFPDPPYYPSYGYGRHQRYWPASALQSILRSFSNG